MWFMRIKKDIWGKTKYDQRVDQKTSILLELSETLVTPDPIRPGRRSCLSAASEEGGAVHPSSGDLRFSRLD